MDKVVRMAKERGVMVGAHPGYPDLLGFGRRKMVLSHDEVKITSDTRSEHWLHSQKAME